MSGGQLLSPQNLINHMKSKGITFNICSEEEAMYFLSESTYYTKIAAYRKNYDAHPSGINEGNYYNLDFAYLKELSTIDMRLRYCIIHMALDIEHALKRLLLQDIETNPSEDGYTLVKSFNTYHPNTIPSIKRKIQNSYCKDLYFNNKNHLPIWVFLEVISFGDLVKLYDHYYKNNSNTTRMPINTAILGNVRDIRNASAHNNCLIHNLSKQSKSISAVNNILIRNLQFKQSIVNKRLTCQPVRDFISLVIAHKILVNSLPTQKIVRKTLKEIFYQRMLRNQCFFTSNSLISTNYKFVLTFLKRYVF